MHRDDLVVETREPRLRNPMNPNESWGGRGKRPTWLRDALTAGKSLADFDNEL